MNFWTLYNEWDHCFYRIFLLLWQSVRHVTFCVSFSNKFISISFCTLVCTPISRFHFFFHKNGNMNKTIYCIYILGLCLKVQCTKFVFLLFYVICQIYVEFVILDVKSRTTIIGLITYVSKNEDILVSTIFSCARVELPSPLHPISQVKNRKIGITRDIRITV